MAKSATIDAAEVQKFSALAAEWWNPSGPFGALHRMNPIRLRYIRERALRHFGTKNARPLKGLRALDLGCGGGLVSVPLARMGAEITGADASEDAIGAARVYTADAGLDIAYETATSDQLVARGALFDLVVALEIIEHVADVNAFLADAAALVKPGGLLILSTINRTAKARALAIVGAERILKWAPEGAHDYDKLVTPEEIRAASPELEWDEPQGIVYNPLGQGWSLSRDIDVNYLISAAKPQ